MNATVTLGGVVLNPAAISHGPIRISTVNQYKSGARQEYYRATKRAYTLEFIATEAETLAIETLSRSASVLSFTDELSRTMNVHPVSFTATVSAEIDMARPLYRVSLAIEEL